jgi:hypothetical protein
MNAPEHVPPDGVYYDMPADDYHAVEALSSGGAKQILRSPAHFRCSRDTPKPPTAQMQFGTAVHFGLLQPNLFRQRVICGPDVSKNSNQWKAFCAANNEKNILDVDQYARCLACIDAAQAHPAARQLLDGGHKEVSLFWRDGKYKVPCKARLDVWNHGGVVDAKTCVDASPEGFARAIGSFLYHLQGAVYFSGCEHALNQTPEFFAFVAVESEPPHAVACYALDRPSILAGMNMYEEALRRYTAAFATGNWVGYAPTVEMINAPRWALRDFY